MKLNEIKLNESSGHLMFLTKDDIANWLVAVGVSKSKFKINDDLTVDVKGDVRLVKFNHLPHFPVKFNTVTGNFSCAGWSKLKTLEGAPRKVDGSFSCNECIALTSLKGGPEEVGFDYNCADCTALESLEGAPRKIVGHFNAENDSSLMTLEGGPDICLDSFYFENCTSLTSLNGAPKQVDGDFSMSGCSKIETLEGSPPEVYNISCVNCTSLVSLVGGPKRVNRSVDLEGCIGLKSLKGLPEYINNSIDLKRAENIKDVLRLLKIKGLQAVFHYDPTLVEILDKYLPEGDIFECQQELLDAGLDEYTEL